MILKSEAGKVPSEADNYHTLLATISTLIIPSSNDTTKEMRRVAYCSPSRAILLVSGITLLFRSVGTHVALLSNTSKDVRGFRITQTDFEDILVLFIPASS